MKNMSRILVGSSLVLAGGSGFLASQALGTSQQTPTKTVTINVATGQTGPQGPQGPAGPAGPAGPPGPAGTVKCPSGFSDGLLIINHPGGQTTIFTCIKD